MTVHGRGYYTTDRPLVVADFQHMIDGCGSPDQGVVKLLCSECSGNAFTVEYDAGALVLACVKGCTALSKVAVGLSLPEGTES